DAPEARRGGREDASAGAGGGRGSTARPASPPESRAPSRPTEPRPSAGGGGGGDGRAGWLSDLLTRASRDEGDVGSAARGEERPSRHAVEALDSISVDIARMIDHEEVSDVWDRYNRGERNVFSRRLYTPQGQQTFDEIRKRYRGDRNFKHTVDRYIAEFERLLDEVSRDERGAATARSYLVSETGKVYTMLAHAAGRFD
ncbi:MAG: methyl-accepting chemotaxis protein, partial [Xanthobacteraceae bacterium]